MKTIIEQLANEFNNAMAEHKQSQTPIKVTFIKKECTSVLVKDASGFTHRVNINRLWYEGNIENADIIEAPKSLLNGDYLKK